MRAFLERHGYNTVPPQTTASAVVAVASMSAPDVLVLHDGLPGTDMPQLLGRLGLLPKRPRSLAIFTNPGPDDARSALAAGATGLVDRMVDADDFIAAVGETAAGRLALCPRVQRRLNDELRRTGPAFDDDEDRADVPPLTPREREVLRLAASGSSTGQMAEVLIVSPSTVKTHLHRAYEKLRADNRAEAVARAMRLGLLA